MVFAPTSQSNESAVGRKTRRADRDNTIVYIATIMKMFWLTASGNNSSQKPTGTVLTREEKARMADTMKGYHWDRMLSSHLVTI